MMRLFIAIVTALVLQAGAQAPQGKRSFEAASIKRSNEQTIGIRFEGNRFVMNGLWISQAISAAYTPCGGLLLDNQIVGAPGWTQVDRYDIEARADSGGKAVPACEMRQMVQSLLEDRFQLKAHFETRELPVFNLVVVKPGKMILSSDQTPPDPSTIPLNFDLSAPPRGRMAINARNRLETIVIGKAVAMDMIIRNLSGSGSETSNRQIVDKTGLHGLFDIQLRFAPETPAGPTTTAPSGPSIFTALQEQLGLKLEPGKAQLPVLVIDSIQRPSEN
jgi:uncharacterized protein (TIGR03435 family)